MRGALSREVQDLARNSIDAFMPLIMQRTYAVDIWTPTVQISSGSVTYTHTSWYLRHGGFIAFYTQLTFSAVSSPTGDVFISGLPFLAKRRSGAWATRISNINLGTGYTTLGGAVAINEGRITLIKSGNNVASAPLAGGDLSSTTIIEIVGFYEAGTENDIPISLEVPGMALRWTFDDTSTGYIDTINGLVLTPQSPNPTLGTGVISNGAVFAGGSLAGGAWSEAALGVGFAIEVWAKRIGNSSIMGKFDSGGSEWWFQNAYAVFFAKDASGTNYAVDFGALLSDDIWYHYVVAIGTDSRLRSYLNGVATGSVSSVMPSFAANTRPLVFGATPVAGPLGLLSGTIDEPAVYQFGATGDPGASFWLDRYNSGLGRRP